LGVGGGGAGGGLDVGGGGVGGGLGAGGVGAGGVGAGGVGVDGGPVGGDGGVTGVEGAGGFGCVESEGWASSGAAEPGASARGDCVDPRCGSSRVAGASGPPLVLRARARVGWARFEFRPLSSEGARTTSTAVPFGGAKAWTTGPCDPPSRMGTARAQAAASAAEMSTIRSLMMDLCAANRAHYDHRQGGGWP
jgi:hypothetical protein